MSADQATLSDDGATLPGDAATRPGDDSGASPAPLALLQGSRIGRYVVLGRLGAGGMGVVVAAYDPELDRKLAIKLLHAHGGRGSDDAHRQLLAEAQALARLNDPNVVAVHDVGTHEGRVFVAMELIAGRTLLEWLATPRPWARVLDVMLAAGRGLAAAHAQHLVHGDFKLANVMLGDDGRVRVMDFGLALADEDPSSHETPAGEHTKPRDRALRRALTGRVGLAGSPAYMAPEQLAGVYGGPAGDQYAFCVALWEGLYGQRPFTADTVPALVAKVLEGKIEETPRRARVPRWLRRAVERGLAFDPRKRWPSLAELLAALERGRVRHRRRGWLALGTLATAGITALVVTHQPARCNGAELELRGIWDEPVRAAMTAAFEGIPMPYAEDARRSTERSFDAYAQRWVAAHTEICEATRVRGDQSEALMDLRIGCLDGQLRDVAAQTALLVNADVEVVENAAQAARALPSPEDCVALERDASGSFQPADQALEATVEQVREQVARARALGHAGKYDEGLTEVKAAAATARTTGYEPVIAEASALMGDLHLRREQPELARAAYEEALYAAIAAGYDVQHAIALLGLSGVWGRHLNDIEAALRYGMEAEAMVKRLGRPPHLDAELALHRGNAQATAGRFEAAIEQLQRAVQLSEGVPIAERTHLSALSNTAGVHGRQGHYRESAATFVRVLELTEQRLGPWHPSVGTNHINLAVTYVRLEDYEPALRHARRALEIFEKTLGPDHPDLGRGYHNLGAVLSATGDIAGAYESYEKALGVKIRSLGPDHVTVAFSANNLCDALVRLGRPAEAIPHCEDALRIWTKAQGDSSPDNRYALISLGEAYLALERPADALPLVRRALAIGERAEIDPAELADARFVVARAVWRAGGDPKEARELAEQAKAGYEASARPSTTELAAIVAWLAEPR